MNCVPSCNELLVSTFRRYTLVAKIFRSDLVYNASDKRERERESTYLCTYVRTYVRMYTKEKNVSAPIHRFDRSYYTHEANVC